jgi:hypothetical protein
MSRPCCTYRRLMGEAFDDPEGIVVIDDTGFAKKGRHSVGVARQYSGMPRWTRRNTFAATTRVSALRHGRPAALQISVHRRRRVRFGHAVAAGFREGCSSKSC